MFAVANVSIEEDLVVTGACVIDTAEKGACTCSLSDGCKINTDGELVAVIFLNGTVSFCGAVACVPVGDGIFVEIQIPILVIQGVAHGIAEGEFRGVAAEIPNHRGSLTAV